MPVPVVLARWAPDHGALLAAAFPWRAGIERNRGRRRVTAVPLGPDPSVEFALIEGNGFVVHTVGQPDGRAVVASRNVLLSRSNRSQSQMRLASMAGEDFDEAAAPAVSDAEDLPRIDAIASRKLYEQGYAKPGMMADGPGITDLAWTGA